MKLLLRSIASLMRRLFEQLLQKIPSPVLSGWFLLENGCKDVDSLEAKNRRREEASGAAFGCCFALFWMFALLSGFLFFLRMGNSTLWLAASRNDIDSFVKLIQMSEDVHKRAVSAATGEGSGPLVDAFVSTSSSRFSKAAGELDGIFDAMREEMGDNLMLESSLDDIKNTLMTLHDDLKKDLRRQVSTKHNSDTELSRAYGRMQKHISNEMLKLMGQVGDTDLQGEEQEFGKLDDRHWSLHRNKVAEGLSEDIVHVGQLKRRTSSSDMDVDLFFRKVEDVSVMKGVKEAARACMKSQFRSDFDATRSEILSKELECGDEDRELLIKAFGLVPKVKTEEKVILTDMIRFELFGLENALQLKRAWQNGLENHRNVIDRLRIMVKNEQIPRAWLIPSETESEQDV